MYMFSCFLYSVCFRVERLLTLIFLPPDEEKEAVKDGRSEEERIQELMSRSDTAVVFAEPVEDELSAGDLEEGERILRI